MTTVGGSTIDASGSGDQAAVDAVPVSTLNELADRWPVLTREELEATHGRRDLVVALVRAKSAYAELLAAETFREPRRQERTVASRWAIIWPKLSAPLVAAAALATVLGSRS